LVSFNLLYSTIFGIAIIICGKLKAEGKNKANENKAQKQLTTLIPPDLLLKVNKNIIKNVIHKLIIIKCIIL
jgi:hypothetical protein